MFVLWDKVVSDTRANSVSWARSRFCYRIFLWVHGRPRLTSRWCLLSFPSLSSSTRGSRTLIRRGIAIKTILTSIVARRWKVKATNRASISNKCIGPSAPTLGSISGTLKSPRISFLAGFKKQKGSNCQRRQIRKYNYSVFDNMNYQK